MIGLAFGSKAKKRKGKKRKGGSSFKDRARQAQGGKKGEMSFRERAKLAQLDKEKGMPKPEPISTLEPPAKKEEAPGEDDFFKEQMKRLDEEMAAAQAKTPEEEKPVVEEDDEVELPEDESELPEEEFKPPEEEPEPPSEPEEFDPGVCIYCGSTEDIQKGHFMAPSKGGKMEVPACATCNASKGDKALMEWLRWVKENRPERWESFVAHNKGKRSELAQKIHKIRDEPDTAPEEPPKETPSTESPMTTHQEDDKFQKLGADLLKVMEKTTGTEGEEEQSKEGA